jgi:hypothetical protein
MFLFKLPAVVAFAILVVALMVGTIFRIFFRPFDGSSKR